uniref:MH2 domain-containing protein n=1 Tax=Timema bartmani TaxID=61472 RepID=A0A7R9I595_9NEOP|nr:unnamed protein product [Timema bartmani]
MRDAKTEELKNHVGHGVKVRMDDEGNILVKRVSKSNVYVKITSAGEDTSIGNDILKLSNCALEIDKPVKLFDMKKFQNNVSRELHRAYPDRRRLEVQCLSVMAFVKNEPELLDSPIWVLIINVVALDMLKSKLPPDDPYYCGLRARVPKFVNSKKNKTDGGPLSPKIPSFQPPHPNGGSKSLHPLHNQLPPKWHAGSFDSGMGVYSSLKTLLTPQD